MRGLELSEAGVVRTRPREMRRSLSAVGELKAQRRTGYRKKILDRFKKPHFRGLSVAIML